MNVCGCSGSQHRYNSPCPAIHAKDTAEATRDRFVEMQCSREGELLMDAVQQSQGRQNDEGNLRAFQLCCFHTVFPHNFLLAGSPAQTLDLTRSTPRVNLSLCLWLNMAKGVGHLANTEQRNCTDLLGGWRCSHSFPIS